jgi:acyl-CoA hydrolase
MLRGLIAPGDGVWWGQGGAEPVPLVDALLEAVPEIGEVRAFSGMSWNPRLDQELPAGLSLTGYGALGRLRGLARRGLVEMVPSHYSTFPRLFAQGRLPCDVGLVQVSPPGRDGRVTLGVGVDYTADALEHTRTVIAEVNHRMPASVGGPRLELSRFAAVMETDRALLERPGRAPDEVDRRIAAHIAALVPDGATLQIGVGSIPTAVLEALAGHRDLGIHSGMVSDGILDLIEAGVVTNAVKEIDRGITVAGLAMCSTEGYDRLADHPIELRPTSYTHAPGVLAQLRSLVAVNAALEVDLLGQVGSEVAGGAYVGALGGQVDFSHAAAVSGTRSIIALRARAGRGDTARSAVVRRLPDGVVSTPRSDVDVVVTEYGAAVLTGLAPGLRRRRLIEIAALEHREALERGSV